MSAINATNGSGLIEGCSFLGGFTAFGINLSNLANNWSISGSQFACGASGEIRLNGAGVTNIRIADNSFTAPISISAINNATYTARGNTSQADLLGFDASYDNPEPKGTAHQIVAQLIPTGVNTALLFNTVSIDHQGVWVPGFASRFTATVKGIYRALGQLSLNPGTANALVQLNIWVNGAPTIPFIATSALMGLGGFCPMLQVEALVPMLLGDYVEFVAFQGAAAAVNTVLNKGTWGSLSWVSSL